MASVTQRFLFPVSTVSARTPGTMTTFCVINTKKNGLQILSLAACASETKNRLLAAQLNWPFGDSSYINCCHVSVAAVLTNKISEESLEIGNLF